ncbi:uncharacterized protein LOC107025000 [Solanum pennellii]|uniref:Uncharacterized protein LOC107025000 n=1 Tax=Solanum pennellii TaxID=28526 RepID=A0ABM1H7A0_SOLPN|nr:uncharacterized protein LOC107025000 [Solanum pennellii]
MVIYMNVYNLLVIVNSNLLIHKVQGEWAVKYPKIIPYIQHVKKLCKRFRKIEFRQTPTLQNELDDALVTIASMINHADNDYINPLDIELTEHPVHFSHLEAESDGLPWYFDIKKYLESRIYPEDATSSQKKLIRHMDLNLFLRGEVLYWRTPDLSLLICVHAVKAVKLIEQIHAGVCGTYMNGFTLARNILRAASGMDVIGPIEPAAFNDHRFILVAIDNFTNWVEAASYKTIYVSNSRSRTETQPLIALDEWSCRSRNKNINKIMWKMVDNHRVYGTETVIPAEHEIPSLRTIQEAEWSNTEWVRKRTNQLTLIDKKRMVAVCHGQLYRQIMIRAFHMRVRTRIFEVCQLVHKHIFPHQDEYKGKFSPNWQGPYMFHKVLSGGALVLLEMDGTAWTKPINSDAVKRYYM